MHFLFGAAPFHRSLWLEYNVSVREGGEVGFEKAYGICLHSKSSTEKQTIDVLATTNPNAHTR